MSDVEHDISKEREAEAADVRDITPQPCAVCSRPAAGACAVCGYALCEACGEIHGAVASAPPEEMHKRWASAARPGGERGE